MVFSNMELNTSTNFLQHITNIDLQLNALELVLNEDSTLPKGKERQSTIRRLEKISHLRSRVQQLENKSRMQFQKQKLVSNFSLPNLSSCNASEKIVLTRFFIHNNDVIERIKKQILKVIDWQNSALEGQSQFFLVFRLSFIHRFMRQMRTMRGTLEYDLKKLDSLYLLLLKKQTLYNFVSFHVKDIGSYIQKLHTVISSKIKSLSELKNLAAFKTNELLGFNTASRPMQAVLLREEIENQPVSELKNLVSNPILALTEQQNRMSMHLETKLESIRQEIFSKTNKKSPRHFR